MSTVIMNAWKTPFKNLDEIVNWAIEFRPKMYEAADQKFNKIVTNLTLNVIDYIYKNKSLPKKIVNTISKRYNPGDLNPDYELSWQVAMETGVAIKYESLSMERDPFMDFRSEMVFIPHDGKIYTIWYGDDRDWEMLFSSLGWEEYWYDGRTDGDGDIPYEEYEARGKTWSDIFDRVNTPSEAGMVVDLLAGKYYHYKKQIINEEKRSNIIKLFVSDHALYEYWLALEDNKAWAEENIKTRGPFTVYDKYRDWVKTEDGKAMRDKLTKEYSNKYPSVEKLNQYFLMKPIDILKDLGE